MTPSHGHSPYRCDSARSFDHATDSEAAVIDVLDEFLQDYEKGHHVDKEALIARHPQHEARLRQCFASVEFLHNAAPEVRGMQLAETNLVGQTLGGYEIVREVGRGGMGIVFEAVQQSLGRRVALKLMPFAALLDRKTVTRFVHEAQAAARLHHPHIVPVYGVGSEDGIYFYSMLLIDGYSLENVVAGTVDSELSGGDSASCRAIARIGIQAAEALHHAHCQGIIHRDVKPSNLMIDTEGKLWVTDFGLARYASDASLTLTGDVIGTVRYMSPEQALGRNEQIDARSDVYSLGVTIYELLTHRKAFDANDHQGYLSKIEKDEPRPPRLLNSAIPRELENIVLMAMSKCREERYPSALDLADDLQRFLDDLPTRARRPGCIDRATKWAVRHRALVAGILLFLVCGLVGTASAAMIISRQQALTQQALDDADQNFRQAREVVDRLGTRIADQLEGIAGAEHVRGEILRETLTYYHRFNARWERSSQPGHEQAIALFKASQIAQRLDNPVEASRDLRKAIVILREASRLRDTRQYLDDLAMCHHELGLVLAQTDNPADAEREFLAAIELLKSAKDAPDSPAEARRLGTAKVNLGLVLLKQQRNDAAIRYLRDATDTINGGDDVLESPQQSALLAVAHSRLSHLLRDDDPQVALGHADAAFQMLQKMRHRNAESLPVAWDLITSLGNLVNLHERLGNYELAGHYLRQAGPQLEWLRIRSGDKGGELARWKVASQQLDELQLRVEQHGED